MLKLDGLVTYFDVDDTLVSYSAPDKDLVVRVNKCPAILVKVFYDTVEELKRHKSQGQRIVVWSNAGADWAEAVVIALGITEYVDVVTSKPKFYYDDMDASQFMGKPRQAGERR